MKERIKLLPFLLVLALVNGCNSDRVFEEYQGMQSLNWAIEDTVAFEVKTSDHPLSSISTIGIRYNDTYSFHNLYVRVLLADSLGNNLLDSLVNIELFDPKTGRPLGDGFGNVYTKYDTLPWIGSTPKEKLRVQFVQYMREEELKGVESVGLKISSKK